jgi:hypothetical protein
MTREDLRFAGSYRIGDVVVYARGSKLGIRKGDHASVLEVDRDSNAITVMRESDGKTFRYNPRRTGTSATLYEPTYREFAAGDRVQFMRAWREDKIANRTLGTLQRLEANGDVWIRLDDGREWRGNLERMPHLDYGCVMTSYSAQGTPAERVLVHLDADSPGVSRMVNQQLIYVAASRGREDMQVFVNARDELVENLLRREEKATALAPEEVGTYRAMAGRSLAL